MGHGGKRVGAGRKPGLPAKKIRERQEQVKAILGDDILPFQVMIEYASLAQTRDLRRGRACENVA